ncbi:YHYH protein [Alteromonas sp. 14N.309.X.WAT.G.H12]|uniref:YHYH protein n=1 Tax=Alteromonas sp. 14N.309.X.WAT.G.H12 TaxID=3120824 RepID=UPI002FCE8052
MMKKINAMCLMGLCCLLLTACNSQDPQGREQGFTLSSPAVNDDSKLPMVYTCDGKGISPPLNWHGAPTDTQYYALIMDHEAPEGMHWYWTLYNIPASKTHIEAGENLGDVGSNSVNDVNQYAPPCSKGPGVKRYTYTLYALSAPVIVNPNATVDRATLLNAIKDISLGSASMSVTYERRGRGGDRPKPNRKPEPNDQTSLNSAYLTANVASPRCTQIKQSVSQAGFGESVSVTCDENYAYVASSTYPEHEMMTGITSTNEQIPVPAKDYVAPIKLHPKKAQSVTTIDAAVGVAVNGVPIYDYSSQGELDVNSYDEQHDTVVLGQLDICGGHAGRGDDYHYHAAPTCMIDAMKNQGSDAIIGWAYDGYPLYGNNNPDGSPIAKGELDVCNGQSDPTFGYRYQTSTTPPYIIQCLVGEVDTSRLPRVAPLNGDTQGIRADLRPPRGSVENLTHTIAEDGSRTMRYSYKGEDYFTTYRPAREGKNCYEFTQKTISNGGKIETGTFCRGPLPNKHTATVTKQNTNPEITGEHHFKLEAWADNWFSAYIGEQLLIEDSVPITTERSFNAESITFSANYPIELNLIIKDFKQNDTGLEYIGARNQQMGDGGFIMQITDTDTQRVVGVSDKAFKCEVLHKAPLNKLCEGEANPVAGEGYCTFMAKEAPEGWLKSDFDYSGWPNATEHDSASVGPKDGYDDIVWDESAKFIWGEDLETDNTLICKATIVQPK